MSYKVHEEEYKGYNINIMQDEDCESPREWDNFGTMICFHKRYTLGDKHDIDFNAFESWDEMEAYLRKEHNAYIILPLYMYDHSGIRIKVGSFNGLLPQGHAEWDSGKIGYIYCTKQDIKDNFIIKRVTEKYVNKAVDLLRAEVKQYDDYVSGCCYGFVITNPDGEETLDSCWGYIGDYDGGVLEDAKIAVDAYLDYEEEEIKQDLTNTK